MKNKIIVFLSIFISCHCLINADLNPCLFLEIDPGIPDAFNPDSVLRDTCRQSPTWGKLYAKKTFEIRMKVYVWGQDVLREDSVYTWRDMDTSFPIIIEGFQNLEQTYGPYTIKRSDLFNDSMFFLYPVIEITFNDYFCVDSIFSALDDIDSVGEHELKYRPGINSINEKINNQNSNIIEIKEINDKNISIVIKTEDQYLLSKNVYLYIYDIYGRLIQSIPYNNNEILFDISNLAHGVYIISFSNYYKLFII